jgi:Helix-turn-helix domain
MPLIVQRQPTKRRSPTPVPVADPDPLLTMEQAAKILAVSKRTMIRWVERDSEGVLDVSTGSKRRRLRIRVSAVRRLTRKMLV